MKKTKNPVLKRVRFYYEVLCDVDDHDVENMTVQEFLQECDNGEKL